MRWYHALYTGESVRRKKHYLKYLISYGRRPTGTYCITVAQQSEDLLDIYHSEVLMLPCMKQLDPLIVGIAGDGEEAALLCGSIIRDIYVTSGSMDVHAFFEEKQ